MNVYAPEPELKIVKTALFDPLDDVSTTVVPAPP
jgi:hypothetical protein